MADQIISADCGFFDSVNGDRLYSAVQMCNPYTRLVTDGIYPAPNGLGSSDFEVSEVTGQLKVKVKSGEGIFAHKWFRLTADTTIDVPQNGTILTRIDSVIIQVNNTSSVRAGRVIYREGTAASNPQPPALTNSGDISEFRIANITVAGGATTVTVSDRRGIDTPWVSSAIAPSPIGVAFKTATIGANSWVNHSQSGMKKNTVSVSSITQYNHAIVSPASYADMEAWSTAKIWQNGQGNGTIEFVCMADNVPETDIAIQVLIFD